MPRSVLTAGLAGILACALGAGAIAQPAPPSASPRPADPLDARAPVPAAKHSSALAGYRRQSDTPAVDWREANDTVRRIGGWRAYAREAQAPEPAASGAVPTPPRSTP